jgi:hypothetical protein
MVLDEAKAAFDKLLPIWLTQKGSIENEQETRFKLIDRMLTDVLGWKHEDIKTEPHVDSGYVDYLITTEGRNRFVIEAKRANRILVDTRKPEAANYNLNSAALKSSYDGIAQAQRYCLDCGVTFSALTSGFEWIAFFGARSDGKPPSTGKAIVFPNLESINNSFALFYDLLSREAVLKRLYSVRISEAEGTQVRLSDNLRPILDRAEMRLMQKSKLGVDLEQLFNQFFSTMAGDADPEMLATCFVESKESREADASLNKITRNLVNQLEVMDSNRGAELESHIKEAVETKKGEFVLIIGNKGAGKTTFVDRFFRLILEKHLRERCVLIRVDLADCSGDMSTIVAWLTAQLIEKIEESLFKGRPPSFDELQGMFYREYERWRDGEHKFLYDSDKNAFKIRFGDYLAEIIEQKPELYVRRLLSNVVRGRLLMPCLVY